MSNNIVLGYSPGDFFYVKAIDEGNMPDDCKPLLEDDKLNSKEKCNDENYKQNADKCLGKQLCDNKKNVELLYDLQNNHSGSDQNYLDTKEKYNDELLNTINLGIGIIASLMFIAKNTYI